MHSLARFSAAMAAAALVVLPAVTAAPAPQSSRAGVYERWAEVLRVTPKWIVLRDEEGREYPVASDAIGLFVTRWPTTLDRISPTALIEATGVDAGSNRMLTDHLDVFEGGARNMVSPGLLFISGSGRGYRPIDFTFNADAYGAPFPGFDAPIQGGANEAPARIHVVGPMVNKNPVQIAWEGNNSIVVGGGPAGVSMSQITPGAIGDVREGDLVYFAASEMRPRSLVLEQLVVCKAMPIDEFAR